MLVQEKSEYDWVFCVFETQWTGVVACTYGAYKNNSLETSSTPPHFPIFSRPQTFPSPPYLPFPQGRSLSSRPRILLPLFHLVNPSSFFSFLFAKCGVGREKKRRKSITSLLPRKEGKIRCRHRRNKFFGRRRRRGVVHLSWVSWKTSELAFEEQKNQKL